MKKYSLVLIVCFLISCDSSSKKENKTDKVDFPVFTKLAAEQLMHLPLECITQEYPNKLGQVLANEEDLATPKKLRPAFYGCFDWHSAVHGHWSLVALLKIYPDLKQAKEIKLKLKEHLTKENIEREIEFFQTEQNANFERTYGWAWLFQLATELKSWDDDFGGELLVNIMPLVDVLELKIIDFLPKLVYPIRVGEHPNTAFALSLTLDYAIAFQKSNLQMLIHQRAKDFYFSDINCPLKWEPSGYDFLSPCLEEARLMAKVLSKDDFTVWMKQFLPDLYDPYFQLNMAKVSDRTDGKLVHLDGLNFSRAWNFIQLSKLPQLQHLENLANQHFVAAYPNLIGDSYEGSHWLGSFALYAILQKENL